MQTQVKKFQIVCQIMLKISVYCINWIRPQIPTFNWISNWNRFVCGFMECKNCRTNLWSWTHSNSYVCELRSLKLCRVIVKTTPNIDSEYLHPLNLTFFWMIFVIKERIFSKIASTPVKIFILNSVRILSIHVCTCTS